MLYESLLPRVPAGRPIENILTGEIHFDPIFDSLFPPLMINGTHGLALRLEAQLLHPRCPDLRVTLPAEDLVVRDFYEKPA